MLLVQSYLALSNVHGIGLFAGEDIIRGTEIWAYHPHSCQIYSRPGFYELCSHISLNAILNLLNYSYIKNQRVFYICDNTRFINHSLNDHNIGFVEEGKEIALRDIKQGEELLENYFLSYDENDFFTNINLFETKNREFLLQQLEQICVDRQNISCKVIL